jgi:hypothetical protein
MIIMHIVAYLAIIVVNVLWYVVSYKYGFKAFEITIMCNLAIYSVCTVIFAVIVN